MTVAPTLRTPRLLLREWRDEDRDALRALNADPEVMRCLLGPMSPAASDAMLDLMRAHFEEHGFGFWALELVDGPPLIGLAGLGKPRFDAHFMPAVEVGWRLARDYWGKGYATEAAEAALDFAFTRLDLDEVVAFTVPANSRSQAVMRRVGMKHDPADDFDHPTLIEGHPLRRHVLYRIDRQTWAARRALPTAAVASAPRAEIHNDRDHDGHEIDSADPIGRNE